MRILVTSGGTKVPIDQVRAITNLSQGTFGAQIVDQFHTWMRISDRVSLDHVVMLHAKGSKLPKLCQDVYKACSFEMHEYETFEEYWQLLLDQLILRPDVVVLAAAVSDYLVENPVNGKVRSDEQMCIRLVPAPKLIGKVRKMCPDTVLCGFKLLVGSTEEQLLAAAQGSIEKNDCDVVVANDLSTIRDTRYHSVYIVRRDGWNRFFRCDGDLAGMVVSACVRARYERDGCVVSDMWHATKKEVL